MSRAKKKYWNRFDCYTLDDWQNYLEKQPHWQNLSSTEMYKHKDAEARSFYRSFVYWLNIVYKRQDADNIRQKFFPTPPRSYSNHFNSRKGSNKFACYSLEEWHAAKRLHPEWDGKSSQEMVAMGSEAKSFYFVFYNWLRTSFPRKERLAILDKFFPPQRKRLRA